MPSPTTNEKRTSVRGLGEIALRVNNLDAMQKFYDEVIGLQFGAGQEETRGLPRPQTQYQSGNCPYVPPSVGAPYPNARLMPVFYDRLYVNVRRRGEGVTFAFEHAFKTCASHRMVHRVALRIRHFLYRKYARCGGSSALIAPDQATHSTQNTQMARFVLINMPDRSVTGCDSRREGL